jgi:HSP20 family protein
MKNQIMQTNQTSDLTTSRHVPTDFRSLMHHFWNFLDASNAETSGISPKIQVTENKEAVNVMAEIPGIDEKDIDVKVSSDGYLCLCGEKKSEVSDQVEDNYFSEISYGMFRRTIQLPWDLDYDATTAKYNNGVLTISIPKSQVEKQKFKKIDIAKA